ncbi:MAG: enoyl-CoA hydratase/isomerase family protein [Thermomicrobia bacterium]|nr:enoyl-CoA hydratase/isomerase family protein [Thermomicrobia bacterium]
MLTVSHAKGVATVTLDRPEVRNALDAALIAAIRDCFDALATDNRVRVVVLTGAGTAFSAGADVRWMQAAAHFTAEENARDARALTTMLAAVDRCPKPVVARVNGAAFGGGAGLIACCDLAIAAAGAQFAFSEVRLGIVPATIGPFVLRKIGPSQARALFLTAERFDAARARELGLVHIVVPAEELDAAVARQTAMLRHGGPRALAAAKELVQELPGMTDGEQRAYTAALIADLRTGPEGQEGLRAFLDRRSPSWITENG